MDWPSMIGWFIHVLEKERDRDNLQGERSKMTHVTKSVSTAQYTCTTLRGVDCMYVNGPFNDMKLIHNPVKWSLREDALIVNQILLTTCNSFKECIEISLENLYVDTG